MIGKTDRFAVEIIGRVLRIHTDAGSVTVTLRSGEGVGIGTSTVNSRLKLYYPDAHTLHFRKEGCWTVAAFCIPEKGGADHYDTPDRG